MRKIFYAVMMCLVVFAMSAANLCFADESVQETPDVKIIIDGKIGVYNESPIIIDQRTLLPFRAVLVNLGVKDDDEHIVWNASDNSVTVNTEIGGKAKKVYLQLDSKTAYVDEAVKELDVAPAMYKDRTYIPARFIAEALGKKVIWDGSYNAVLIRDEADFNEVKAILDKSNGVLKSIDTYKCSGDMDMAMTMGDSGKTDTKATYTAEIDYKNKVMFMQTNMDMNLGGPKDTQAEPSKMTVSMDAYYNTEAYYVKLQAPQDNAQANPMAGKWIKAVWPNDLGNMMFEKNDNLKMFADLNINEAVCAGLVIDEEASDDKTLVLKGDVYLKDYFDKIKQMQSSLVSQSPDINIGKMNIVMYIDKATYLTSKTIATMEMAIDIQNQNIQYEISTTCLYKDFNSNFELKLPEELSQAIDMSSALTGLK